MAVLPAPGDYAKFLFYYHFRDSSRDAGDLFLLLIGVLYALPACTYRREIGSRCKPVFLLSEGPLVFLQRVSRKNSFSRTPD